MFSICRHSTSGFVKFFYEDVNMSIRTYRAKVFAIVSLLLLSTAGVVPYLTLDQSIANAAGGGGGAGSGGGGGG